MKKKIALLLVLVMTLSLVACGKKDGESAEYEFGAPTEDFYLEVEDSFTLKDKGTVATGVVYNSPIYVGMEVDILTVEGERLSTSIAGLEVPEGECDAVEPGRNCGILLADIARKDVARGDVIVLKGCEDTRETIRVKPE